MSYVKGQSTVKVVLVRYEKWYKSFGLSPLKFSKGFSKKVTILPAGNSAFWKNDGQCIITDALWSIIHRLVGERRRTFVVKNEVIETSTSAVAVTDLQNTSLPLKMERRFQFIGVMARTHDRQPTLPSMALGGRLIGHSILRLAILSRCGESGKANFTGRDGGCWDIRHSDDACC